MKKVLFASALLLTIASCSFVKDVQSHCSPRIVSGSIQTGSFDVCLKCDSLAKVAYNTFNKAIEKK